MGEPTDGGKRPIGPQDPHDGPDFEPKEDGNGDG